MASSKSYTYFERGYYVLEKEGKIVSQAVFSRSLLKYCVLYADAGIPISNHVYEKKGYVKRVECEELEFYE